MFCKKEQLWNKESEIEVIEFGKMIEVILVPEKAELPIEVTEFGILIEVRLPHPANAPSPIDVIEFG
jgi:hypothetical protein